jgi:hypothetical protein
MAEPVATMADLADLERKVLMGDKASLQCGTLGVLGLHPGARHLSAGAGRG